MKNDQLIRQIEIRDRKGQVIGTKEVVTYQGLLSKAHEEGLAKIRTTLVQIPTDDNGRTAIAKAEVETSRGLFEALGDASPENVNSFIVPHLIRMAETRAKARALRDAVNIGVVSFEELDGEVPAAESSLAGSGASSRTPLNIGVAKRRLCTAQHRRAQNSHTVLTICGQPVTLHPRFLVLRICNDSSPKGHPPPLH